jgi:phage shock protein E
MAKTTKIGPILTILIIAVIVYLVYTYYTRPSTYEKSLKISVAEARSRRFGLIIDVRTPKEREELGYYPNSIPISVERLSKEVPMDISNKNTWILVYCNTGARAGVAAEILYNMGYPNVRYITESYLTLLPGSSY